MASDPGISLLARFKWSEVVGEAMIFRRDLNLESTFEIPRVSNSLHRDPTGALPGPSTEIRHTNSLSGNVR